MLGAPGAVVLAVLRVRGLVAVCAAPAVSVSIIGVSAIVAPWIHLRWGAPVVVLGTAITAAAAFTVKRLVPALRPAQPRDRRWTVPTAVVGTLVALGITTAVLANVTTSPESFTQGYDTVFHLNATENVLRTGNASSFAISSFILPSGSSVFYPAAWHGLASLLIILTGISVPAATNILWLAVAGVVWPLACVFLVRVLAGPNRTVLAATAVLAAVFPAFPYLLLFYGSAYPNALSNAVLPVGIGLVLLTLRPDRHAPISPAMAMTLVVLFLPGAGLAQPNGVFSILLVLTPLLAAMLVGWLRRGFGLSRRLGWLRLGIAVAVAGGGIGGLFLLPQFRGLFIYTSPAFLPFPLAALRNLTQAPDPVWFPSIVLTLLVLLGLWVCVKTHKRRWLVATLALLVLTYPLTTATNLPLANMLMAPWWDNPERVAAVMPLVAVPLAGMGLGAVVAWLGGKVRGRRRALALRFGEPATAAVLAVVLGLANPGLGQMRDALATMFDVPPGPNNLAQVDADELALIHRLDSLTTPDDVLANNPYNGSALAMALAGRTMLFPYSSQNDLDQDLYNLRFWLNLVGTDPAICAAAKRKGVTYLLDFGTSYIPAFDNPRSLYPGVTLAPDSDAFTLVAREGHAKLYKLTRCGGEPLH
ncbi:DUF6541 family protein [Specibacter cremeus]|uniref:DUF6541 family protein n=1 Tax=Specibacter cremeus TaxID=1629051 RepID=UPI003B839A15